MEQLTPKDAEIILVFLNRVELKGSESEAHAMSKHKLMAIRDGRELPKLSTISDDAKTN